MTASRQALRPAPRIRMSRSGPVLVGHGGLQPDNEPHGVGFLGRRSATRSRSRFWHATCCLVALSATGCFYVKPIRDPVVNLPPDIQFPLEQPSPVIVQDNRFVVAVYATDPEDDTIFFEWPDLTGVDYTEEVYQSGDLWVSRVEVLDAAALRSDLLRAFVLDGRRENLVTVTWQVVEP